MVPLRLYSGRPKTGYLLNATRHATPNTLDPHFPLQASGRDVSLLSSLSRSTNALLPSYAPSTRITYTTGGHPALVVPRGEVARESPFLS